MPLRGGAEYGSGMVSAENGFVLVGGWPGSGKSTLARALSAELTFDYLSKDEVKEALMDQLGAPETVAASQQLGRAAVAAVLRVARGCRGAVIDSTWFPYTAPMVRQLPAACVEVRCIVPVSIARLRYLDRRRDERHLDAQRDEAELWGKAVEPLGVGPLINVDTTDPVDIPELAERIRRALPTST